MEKYYARKILIIDDDKQLRMLLKDRLKAQNYFILEAENGKEGFELYKKERPDLILLDLQMPVLDGIGFLKQFDKEKMDTPVVVLTAFATIERAVEAMKLGAYDFLPKPCRPDHIQLVVRKALERQFLKEENRFLKQEINSRYRMIIGNNPGMKKVVDVAQNAAKSNATILVEGESGTGKQLMAHFIHEQSGRKDKPFVQVNCTTLSEHLMESDLFGHEKGAFTGALKQKKGRFELANGGTIFLDEIGDLSPSLQAKLLHVLEYGEFQRVGGLETIRVNVRIIAATNKDLQAEVSRQKFREDLFYRLNVVRIKLPPLRSRVEDIPVFVEQFIQKHSQNMGKHMSGVTPETLKRLQQYSWPGNIRELENVIERAVVLETDPVINLSVLPALTEENSSNVEIGASLEDAIISFKKQFISRTLSSTNNNQTEAAKLLDIQRTYLNRLIKELNI
ncbi:sigma-54-dependent Fis family transcriptional regulator [candidate division KSB1 bacterium]|nr:sigma-54-dependent Fis family transcriptional regulator [candidate division KSB1 bacterium]